MKTLTLTLLSLCGLAAAQGTSYTTPGGTTHYRDNQGRTVTSYTTPGGTTHYRDNQGRTGTSYTTPGGTTHYNGSMFKK